MSTTKFIYFCGTNQELRFNLSNVVGIKFNQTFWHVPNEIKINGLTSSKNHICFINFSDYLFQLKDEISNFLRFSFAYAYNVIIVKSHEFQFENVIF